MRFRMKGSSRRRPNALLFSSPVPSSISGAKPGGVDFDKARELGIHTKWALSLPGKAAPVTAAKYIKSTVYNILDELGV